jgi:hypothetical protein
MAKEAVRESVDLLERWVREGRARGMVTEIGGEMVMVMCWRERLWGWCEGGIDRVHHRK